MSSFINSCPHKNELIDVREGDVICAECGIVIDRYYDYGSVNLSNFETENITQFEKNFVLESLERLNLSSEISYEIFKEIQKESSKKKNESILSGIIYKTLVKLNIPFTLKDICSVTGVETKKISHKSCESNIIIINSIDLLERACAKLKLNFLDYTLIKEKINDSNNGFNPSTIISAHIFDYCKKNNLKISMKEISNITGISCMSIKRYIKKNVGTQRS